MSILWSIAPASSAEESPGFKRDRNHVRFGSITLPERERRRLIGAQANVKRWRKETQHGNGKCPTDLKREAKAAWKRFTWCLRSLPAHEVAPLWQAVLGEAAAHV